VLLPARASQPGLQVSRLVGGGDMRSAAIVARIAEEESAHVAVGVAWFRRLCAALGDEQVCVLYCAWSGEVVGEGRGGETPSRHVAELAKELQQIDGPAGQYGNVVDLVLSLLGVKHLPGLRTKDRQCLMAHSVHV
jgi:hypothetical protein